MFLKEFSCEGLLMKKCFFMVLMLLQTGIAAAGGVVISNGIESITPVQLKKLYRANINNIEGVRIKLADLESLQGEFLQKNVGKSAKNYKKIWSRKLFVQGIPGPRVFKTPEAVIQFLRETPNAIAYIPALPEGVTDIKVLIEF